MWVGANNSVSKLIYVSLIAWFCYPYETEAFKDKVGPKQFQDHKTTHKILNGIEEMLTQVKEELSSQV